MVFRNAFGRSYLFLFLFLSFFHKNLAQATVADFGPTFIQYQDNSTATPVLFTLGSNGTFELLFYPNSSLGWVNPANGYMYRCSYWQQGSYVHSSDVGNCSPTQALSSISSTSRYPNGQLIRSGGYIYHENGRILTSSTSYYYYFDGQNIKSGSYYYWPNGRNINSGTTYYYYPNGNHIKSGSYFYYENGTNFITSTNVYDISGDRIRSASALLYDGYRSIVSDLTAGISQVNYPSTYALRDTSGYLYCRDFAGFTCFTSQILGNTALGTAGRLNLDVKPSDVFASIEIKSGNGLYVTYHSKVGALPSPSPSSTPPPGPSTTLKDLGHTFVQYKDISSSTPVLFSLGSNGTYQLLFYPNSTLGWVNPVDGYMYRCRIWQSGYTHSSVVDDCTPSQRLSDITSTSRYTNGQLIRSGSYIYYEDGQILTSNTSYYYYSDGDNIKSGSYYYWPNGRNINNGTTYYYYPNGNHIKSGSYFYYENGTNFITSTNVYDISGDRIRSASALLYDGYRSIVSDLTAGISQVNYPSTYALRDTSGYLYCRDFAGFTCFTSQILGEVGLGTYGRLYLDVKPSDLFASIEIKVGAGTYVTYHSKSGTSPSPSPSPSVSPSPTPLPPAPVGLSLTPVSTNSVLFAWSSGGGTTASYRVAISEGSGIPNCATGTSVGVATQYTFSDLKAATLYTASVCPLDVISRVGSRSSISGITLTPPPPTAPVNLAVSSKTDTSISFSWTSGGGSTSSFRIAHAVGIVAPLDCSSGTNFSINSGTVSNLLPDTDYSFTLCALNEIGQQAVGPSLTDRTVRPLPPPSPLVLTAGLATTSTVDLVWISGGGSTSGFLLKTVEGDIAPTDCVGGLALGKTLITYRATGFNSGKYYSFALCAQNSLGELSAPLFATAATLSSPPTLNKVAAASSTSLFVSWTTPNDAPTWIVVSTINADDCSLGSAVTGTSTTVTGLLPSTRYYVKACTKNLDGSFNSGSTLDAMTFNNEVTFKISAKSQSKTNITAKVSRNKSGGVSLKTTLLFCEVATGDCISRDVVFGASVTQVTISVSVLKPATQYQVILNPYSAAPLRIVLLVTTKNR